MFYMQKRVAGNLCLSFFVQIYFPPALRARFAVKLPHVLNARIWTLRSHFFTAYKMFFDLNLYPLQNVLDLNLLKKSGVR